MNAPYTLTPEGPHLADSHHAEDRGFRTLGGLAPVTAVPVSESEPRVQYWTFGDVWHVDDGSMRSRLPVKYDLTFLADRPIGWESPKTHGHVHVTAAKPHSGFAELYEVLEGTAAVLVQDLLPGPAATFVALIVAGPGQILVVPPRLYHCSMNLGTSFAVLGDVVAREATEDYRALQVARGMAYYIDTNGEAIANPAYSDVPPLLRVDAEDWMEQSIGPLYRWMISDSADTDWLCDEEAFWSRFPEHGKLSDNGRFDVPKVGSSK